MSCQSFFEDFFLFHCTKSGVFEKGVVGVQCNNQMDGWYERDQQNGPSLSMHDGDVQEDLERFELRGLENLGSHLLTFGRAMS